MASTDPSSKTTTWQDQWEQYLKQQAATRKAESQARSQAQAKYLSTDWLDKLNSGTYRFVPSINSSPGEGSYQIVKPAPLTDKEKAGLNDFEWNDDGVVDKALRNAGVNKDVSTSPPTPDILKNNVNPGANPNINPASWNNGGVLGSDYDQYYSDFEGDKRIIPHIRDVTGYWDESGAWKYFSDAADRWNILYGNYGESAMPVYQGYTVPGYYQQLNPAMGYGGGYGGGGGGYTINYNYPGYKNASEDVSRWYNTLVNWKIAQPNT